MPIGNLDDLTLRMMHYLSTCDYIISDRPVDQIQRVLEKFKFKKKIIMLNSVDSSYADMDQVNQVAKDILDGQIVLLVASEGQVAISDPGVHFIQKCITDKLPYEVLPGPCAGITAYVASGLSDSSVLIIPSVEKENIEETFNDLKNNKYITVVHVWAKDLEIIIDYIDKNYRWFNEKLNKYVANRIIAVCCDLTMPSELIFMDWAHKIKNNKNFSLINENTRVSLVLGEFLHTEDCDHRMCNMFRDLIPGQLDGLQ